MKRNRLREYIFAKMPVHIVSAMRDFRGIPEEIELARIPWMVQTTQEPDLVKGTIDGLSGTVGEIVLIYTEANDVKDFLGVRVKYHVITDPDDMNRWMEETFRFEPYGQRWQRDGLEFPAINDLVVNPGGEDRNNVLVSNEIRNQIFVVLNKIQHAIEKANEIGKV